MGVHDFPTIFLQPIVRGKESWTPRLSSSNGAWNHVGGYLMGVHDFLYWSIKLKRR